MTQLIIVDNQNKIIRYEEKEKCHNDSGILHRAFSIFIFNPEKQLLLQQRSKLKRLWPLYWSNTCCSHPIKGKNLLESAVQRLQEECGISSELKYLYEFQYQARYGEEGSENEICAVLIGRHNLCDDIQTDPVEIANSRWADLNELKKDIKANPDKYTPWFKMEIKELLSTYQREIQEIL